MDDRSVSRTHEILIFPEGIKNTFRKELLGSLLPAKVGSVANDTNGSKLVGLRKRLRSSRDYLGSGFSSRDYLDSGCLSIRHLLVRPLIYT
ncbi:hypothetical protein CHS0354_034815 [Potamilus streckersoni]|uniref:Uncharacterized protein n=1 Tax=Potamilus streckersoni TaxID=2493646 RepID=A0AAE0VJD9_9BIVA|nr:hypothetical protein CHS0354_034815 [Potamilus streckersoni]